jgi:hypothetical protein
LTAFATMLVGSQTWAADPEKLACVAAHAEGQELRNAGHPMRARVRFEACARATCPPMVRAECVRFVGQIDAALPTLLIEARAPDGTAVTAVRMLVDGEPLLEELTGVPVKIAPGEHLLRFEPADARIASREVKIVARDGEKNIHLVLDLASQFRPNGIADAGESDIDCGGTTKGTPPCAEGRSCRADADCERGRCAANRCLSAPAPAARAAEPMPPRPLLEAGGRVPVLGLGLLAVSVGSLATFTIFALKGKGEQRELEGCARTCASTDVDRMYRDYLVADVALGLALVAGATGTWLVLSSSRSPSKIATVRFAPRGAGGVVSATF